MLPRGHRLTTSTGFGTATRRGRRAGTRTLVLHLALVEPAAEPTPVRESTQASTSHPCGGSPRVGFVVSKAVGNAVVRNRVRRRLRHLAADRLSRLPARSVLVVRALPPASVATYDALGRDFETALRRLDLRVGAPVAGGAG